MLRTLRKKMHLKKDDKETNGAASPHVDSSDEEENNGTCGVRSLEFHLARLEKTILTHFHKFV